MNVRELLAQDIQNTEIQENLMKPIKVNDLEMFAFVGSGMIAGVLSFGGMENESSETFRIPLESILAAGLVPLINGDVITYAGKDYVVNGTPPDETAPLLSYKAILD